MSSADRIAGLEPRHFWFVARDEFTDALVGRVASAAVRVLDAGTGTGRFAAALASSGRIVVGVDAHLPTQPPAGPQWLEASVECLPLPDASFDLVLARDVLEHVDDHRALDEIRRVLSPGGVLIAAVPAWPSMWSRRDVVAGHLRRYRRRSIVDAVERAGLRVVEVRGYQCFLLPALLAVRRFARSGDEAVLRREEDIHPLVNRVLLSVNRVEVAMARRRSLCPPTGSSLFVVAVVP